MSIKIVTDSTSSLSPEIASRFGIEVIPMVVVAGTEQYKDGIEINPPDVFEYFEKTGELCSTTAINYATYVDIFTPLAAENDAVIYISLGSGFSVCYQNAVNASQEFNNVYVIDSENLSSGQGLLVIEAAQMAAAGATLEEMLEKLSQVAKRVEASFILNQLNYMVKGGRCSAVTAMGANLLRIKPSIAVKDGKMGVDKKFRGKYHKALEEYVIDRLKDRTDIRRDKIFLTYSSADEEAVSIARRCIEQYGPFDEVFENTSGCTVACHCGPNTLGVLFIRNE